MLSVDKLSCSVVQNNCWLFCTWRFLTAQHGQVSAVECSHELPYTRSNFQIYILDKYYLLFSIFDNSMQLQNSFYTSITFKVHSTKLTPWCRWASYCTYLTGPGSILKMHPQQVLTNIPSPPTGCRIKFFKNYENENWSNQQNGTHTIMHKYLARANKCRQ